ncbi:MAG: biotin carboxyl carrier domain-containing protein [Alphaproteobacteria bacterium]|nr:biotin carboxyl carrier domain-containing protein [Alphaproteobacteria bacterium]
MALLGDEIINILKTAHSLGLRRLRLRQGDFTLEYDADGVVDREGEAKPTLAAATAPAAPPPAKAAAAPRAAVATVAPPRPGLVAVTSPLPGTFYRRPAPEKPPFAEVGAAVVARDTVCLIEVMKLFNSVPAGIDGVVAAFAAADAAVVEAGQVLVWIEPKQSSLGSQDGG